MSLLLTLILACTQSGEPADSVTPQAKIGTGEWEWAELSDGAEIEVIQGPQGGFHLLGSVRVAGIESGDPESLGDADNPTSTFQVWVEGVPLAPSAVYVQGLEPILGEGAPFSHEMVGRFAILDIESDDVLDGVSVEFEVEVVDVEGVVVQDSRSLLAVPHPLNN
ncbi:MAG: hypothetical protein VX519_09540 [Myxococcota bacterium]|nr:hypothetical protein [Myxococcota bacterium]